jgi:hypothetical protein
MSEDKDVMSVKREGHDAGKQWAGTGRHRPQLPDEPFVVKWSPEARGVDGGQLAGGGGRSERRRSLLLRLDLLQSCSRKDQAYEKRR